MKHAFTDKIVERYTERSVRNFCNSLRPKEEKKHLKEMVNFVHFDITDHLKTSWGMANILYMDDRQAKVLNITKDGYLIEPLNGYYHLVISLNRRILQWARPQDVFDTVSHELAHCFDFVMRGETYHDKYWRDIAVDMGCNGSTLADIRVPKYVHEKDIFKNSTLRKGYHDLY